MRCVSTREQLLDPITQADKAVGKNATLPVLSCLHLSVESGVLTVSATNLEIGVAYSVSVVRGEDGAIAVPSSVLAQVLLSLPVGSEVELVSTDTSLEVVGVHGTSRIALQDVSEFPVLPRVEGGVSIELPGAELRNVLQAVSYCVSTSTIKPELASVFVHAIGSELLAAATDSFRLIEKQVSLKQSVTCDPFLIPGRSALDLIRILDRSEGLVACEVGQHQLSLTLPGVYDTLRLTSGTFPDYRAIVPKEFSTEVTVLAKDLERVLKKASIFSDQFNQTTLTVEPHKKQLVVHTENRTVGETTDSIPCSITGGSLTIRFNQRYLLDSLHSIATDSVVLQFVGPAQSAVVRPIGDETMFYLVMPLNR